MILRVHRQVGPLQKVLSQLTIGILIGPALPRTLRIAEVNVDVEGRPEQAQIQLYKLGSGSATALEIDDVVCRHSRQPESTLWPDTWVNLPKPDVRRTSTTKSMPMPGAPKQKAPDYAGALNSSEGS
jgi:hypothetical protein